jgi:two-component system response regulator HydG
VDVRVIAASNRDLAAEVRAGRFREDLYYRLNVVPIRIPPLRERPEDIALLVDHFVRNESAKLGRTVQAVADDTLAALRAHTWPGNVRELRNVIERAVLMSTGDLLRLPGPLCASTGTAEPGAVALDGRPLADLVRAYKVALIERALTVAGGNQRRAAEILGLHRPSLTRMLRELGITARTAPRV